MSGKILRAFSNCTVFNGTRISSKINSWEIKGKRTFQTVEKSTTEDMMMWYGWIYFPRKTLNVQ